MLERDITPHILNVLSDTTVVFLKGARQTGKSTLVRAIAAGPYSYHYVTLDNAGVYRPGHAHPYGQINNPV
jgi:predicted AAA+ superfamily ATPase